MIRAWFAAAAKNWHTTMYGILAFLAGVPGFISALEAWGNHQPVNWRQVLVSIAITAIGLGLASAKDGTTHSTQAEIDKSTVDAAKK